MKYKMLKDLPFIKSGSIFGHGCWAGGGWGIDRGSDAYGSHNGIKIFEKYEDLLLDNLISNKEWIEPIPETFNQAIDLYDKKYIDRKQLLENLKMIGENHG